MLPHVGLECRYVGFGFGIAPAGAVELLVGTHIKEATLQLHVGQRQSLDKLPRVKFAILGGLLAFLLLGVARASRGDEQRDADYTEIEHKILFHDE